MPPVRRKDDVSGLLGAHDLTAPEAVLRRRLDGARQGPYGLGTPSDTRQPGEKTGFNFGV
jgi:hypothetical protein